MRISDWSSDVCSSDLLVRAQQGNPLMLIFYGHPFSSYTWKALIALYEKGLEFDYRVIEPDRPQHMEELRAHWPIGKFPLLVDGERALFAATIIIEYLHRLAPEPPLIPADPDPARAVRPFARAFSNTVMPPLPAVVADA